MSKFALIILAFSTASAASLPPDAQEYSDALNQWYECRFKMQMRLLRSPEPSETVANVILAACRYLEETARQTERGKRATESEWLQLRSEIREEHLRQIVELRQTIREVEARK